jgi:hypothetical protein
MTCHLFIRAVNNTAACYIIYDSTMSHGYHHDWQECDIICDVMPHKKQQLHAQRQLQKNNNGA